MLSHPKYGLLIAYGISAVIGWIACMWGASFSHRYDGPNGLMVYGLMIAWLGFLALLVAALEALGQRVGIRPERLPAFMIGCSAVFSVFLFWVLATGRVPA